MLKQFINYITQQANFKKVIIGIIIIIVFNTFLFPLFPRLFNVSEFPINSTLDLKFSYTTDVVYSIFNDLGAKGRKVYLLSEIFVDFPYAIFYGFVYSFIIVLLLKNTNIATNSYLVIIPFGISFFDILENIGLISLLYNYPKIITYLVNTSSLATSIKWTFAMLTFVVIVYLFIKQRKKQT